MRPRSARTRTAAVAVVFGVLVSGLTTGSAPGAAAPAAPAAVKSTAGLPGGLPVPAALTTQRLAWSPCYATPHPFLPPTAERLECTTVTVPLDWRRAADGRTIRIAVSRLRPATGTARGLLMTNPGGPGGAGVYLPAVLGERPAVAAAYDIIGIDVRGTGRSTSLTCGSQSLSGNDPRDRSRANLRLIAETDDLYARYCAFHGGALLPVVNTEQTVRDLDLIRHVLGAPRTSWVGYSGGSWLGAHYATAFPHRVDRFVLDSNPEFTTTWQESFAWQPLGFERRFRQDFATWAARHNDRLRLGATAQQVRGFYERLRADLRVPVDVPLIEDFVVLSYGSGDVDMLIAQAMYSKFTFFDLAQTLRDLRDRADARAAGRQAGGTVPLSAGARRLLAKATGAGKSGPRPVAADSPTATFHAVICNDTPWGSRADIVRESARQGARYPLIGWWTVSNPCVTWKRPSVTLPRPTGRGVPPVLMVQSERDAATPIEGAVRAHARFAGSRMVTVTAEGDHGLYGGDNACLNQRVDSFLLTGELPRQDVTCAGVGIPAPPDPEQARTMSRPDAKPTNPLLRSQWYADAANGRTGP